MLEISPSKVVQIIFQHREGPIAAAELHAFIENLNEDEKAHLTALAWVGRGAFEPEDFAEALATAHTQATTPRMTKAATTPPCTKASNVSGDPNRPYPSARPAVTAASAAAARPANSRKIRRRRDRRSSTA